MQRADPGAILPAALQAARRGGIDARQRNGAAMAAMSLTEAAERVGVNRSTLFRAIKAGRISAERNATTGQWSIDPAELARAYPAAIGGIADNEQPEPDARSRNAILEAEVAGLRARLDDALATIADLRRRLDSAEAERRAERERNAALLTDQRAPRRWLRLWGRG